MKSKPPKLFKFTRKSNETEFETGGPTNHFRRTTSFATETPQDDQENAKAIFLKISAKSHTEDETVLEMTATNHDLIKQKIKQSREFDYDDGSRRIWSEENLVEYLENPKKYVPGSKLFFEYVKRPPTLRAANTVTDENIDCQVKPENSNLEELNPLLAFKLFRSRIS